VIFENSKATIIIPLSIALGIILSPESLVILGNGMGSGGFLFLAFLLLAMAVYFMTALSHDEVFALSPGWAGEARLMRQAFGWLPATVLVFCSRVVFIICASTGMLATAGYAFNEVFVYWFPNLGFSFCLLGFLLLINLLDRRVVTLAQMIFVSVALMGLAVLVIAGFLKMGQVTEFSVTGTSHAVALSRIAPVGLILFVGFELAAISSKKKGEQQQRVAFPLLAAIGLAGFIFSAWGLVSLRYVDMQELTGSTIPHMIAARAILGENGRLVMGLVVIAGSLSAVNGLIYTMTRLLSGMARENLLPAFFAGSSDRSLPTMIILVLGIAVMLGLGMAGKPALGIYIRSALLFWLLFYSAVHLSLLKVRKNYLQIGRVSRFGWRPVVSTVSVFIMLVGFIGLLWTDPESVELAKFMLTISVAGSILGLFWLRLNRGGKAFVTVGKGHGLNYPENASSKS
jgi:amino acid transporter